MFRLRGVPLAAKAPNLFLDLVRCVLPSSCSLVSFGAPFFVIDVTTVEVRTPEIPSGTHSKKKECNKATNTLAE